MAAAIRYLNVPSQFSTFKNFLSQKSIQCLFFVPQKQVSVYVSVRESVLEFLRR